MKKKKAEEAKANAAQAASPSDQNKTSNSVSLIGIGGQRIKQNGATKTETRPASIIRLQKDINELDESKSISVEFPNPNDLTKFKVKIIPETGFWTGAPYLFSFDIPFDYPHTPPKVLCLTKIYHPNIDLEGKVCLNILRADWKPVLDINAIFYGLNSLFYDPNPNDPLNKEAAELFRKDLKTFERVVKMSLKGGDVREIGRGIYFPQLL